MRARTLTFLCFVGEVHKKVYVQITVRLCMRGKLCNGLSLSCAKQKDVTASRNDCQNHVQFDENTSKIKIFLEVHYHFNIQEKYYLSTIVNTRQGTSF